MDTMAEFEVIEKVLMYGKGRVTVPKEVRDFLSIKDGDYMFFLRDREGKIYIKKAPKLEKGSGRFVIESP